jgi:hypothetical protein
MPLRRPQRAFRKALSKRTWRQRRQGRQVAGDVRVYWTARHRAEELTSGAAVREDGLQLLPALTIVELPAVERSGRIAPECGAGRCWQQQTTIGLRRKRWPREATLTATGFVAACPLRARFTARVIGGGLQRLSSILGPPPRALADSVGSGSGYARHDPVRPLRPTAQGPPGDGGALGSVRELQRSVRPAGGSRAHARAGGTRGAATTGRSSR